MCPMFLNALLITENKLQKSFISPLFVDQVEFSLRFFVKEANQRVDCLLLSIATYLSIKLRTLY